MTRWQRPFALTAVSTLIATTASATLLSDMLMSVSGPGGSGSGINLLNVGADGAPSVLLSPHEPYVIDQGGFALTVSNAYGRYEVTEDDETRKDEANLFFVAMDYGLTNEISLGLTLPWFTDTLNIADRHGVTGFSDLQLRAKYWATRKSDENARRSNHNEVGLSVALTLPTGQVDRDVNGEETGAGTGLGAWLLSGDVRANHTIDDAGHFRLFGRLGGEVDIDDERDMSSGAIVGGLIYNRIGLPASQSCPTAGSCVNFGLWLVGVKGMGEVDDGLPRSVASNGTTDIVTPPEKQAADQDSIRFGVGSSGSPACWKNWSWVLSAEARWGLGSRPTQNEWGILVGLSLIHDR